MTDPDRPDQIAEAKAALSVLATLPTDAVRAAAKRSNQIGQWWFFAAMVLAPALAIGLTWVLLTFWAPVKSNLQGFDVDLGGPTGPRSCVRDEDSPAERPRYVCVRVSAPFPTPTR